MSKKDDKKGKPANPVPDNDDLAAWQAEFFTDVGARKFIKRHGISDEVASDLGFGVHHERIRLPIFGEKGDDGEYAIENCMAITHLGEGTKRGIPARGTQTFSWPHIDRWNYDNPVVLVPDELCVAALLSIGVNAICNTSGAKAQRFRFLPRERLRLASHIVVSQMQTKTGVTLRKEIARNVKEAFPETKVTMVEVSEGDYQLSLYLGLADDPLAAWEKLLAAGSECHTATKHGASFWEGEGQIWKAAYGDPVAIAPFTGKLIEQGRKIIAGIEEGKTWLFELTHHLGHKASVRTDPNEHFRRDVLKQAGPEFNFHSRDGEDIQLHISSAAGLDYETKHQGWQFGFVGDDFSKFYTPDVIYRDTGPVENDEIEMEAPQPVIDFRLPAPDSGPVLKKALQLIWTDLIEMHYHWFTMPMLAVTMLAPIRRLIAPDYDPYLVFVRGQTGCGKTTRVKAFQCFFGEQFWDAKNLLTWTHTVMWLETVLAQAGDAMVVIDDLNYDKMKDGGDKEVRRWLQGTSQGSPRQRLDKGYKAGVKKPTEYATKIVTCELLPRGDQSMIARSLVLDVPHIDAIASLWREPHDRVKVGRKLLPAAMSSWIAWVMASPERAREYFEEHELAAKNNVMILFDRELGEGWGAKKANLVRAYSRIVMESASYHLFLQWSHECGALTLDRYDQLKLLWDEEVVERLMVSQVNSLGEEGIANELVMSIESAVAAGRATFIDRRDTASGLIPTRASPTAPTIGEVWALTGLGGAPLDYEENHAFIGGTKVVVFLSTGVSTLWPQGKLTWKQIKNCLEPSGDVIYKRTKQGRLLLCRKGMAEKMVTAMGMATAKDPEEAEDVNW